MRFPSVSIDCRPPSRATGFILAALLAFVVAPVSTRATETEDARADPARGLIPRTYAVDPSPAMPPPRRSGSLPPRAVPRPGAASFEPGTAVSPWSAWSLDAPWDGEPITFIDNASPRDDLRLFLRKHTGAAAWRGPERRIEPLEDGRFRVLQTAEIHARLRSILETLEAGRRGLVRVEVAIVPPGALSPSPDRPELEASLSRAGASGLYLALLALNGKEARVSSGRRRSALIDYEVNATGLQPVTNPVVAGVPLGAGVVALPRVVSGHGLIVLRLEVTRLLERPAGRRTGTFFGELELPRLAERSLSTELLVRPGETVVAGLVEKGDATEERRREARGETAEDVPDAPPASFAVLVRARPVGARSRSGARQDSVPDDPLPSNTPLFRIHGEGVLLTRPLPAPRGLFESLDDRQFRADRALENRIRRSVSPATWSDPENALTVIDGRVHATAPPDVHAELTEFLHAEVRRRVIPARLEVEEYTGPTGAVLEVTASADARDLLAPGWRDSPGPANLTRTHRALVTGLFSEEVLLRAIDSRGFIAGVESVAGGCPPTPPFADPIVLAAGSGFALRATLESASEPEHLALKLRHVLGDSEDGGTATFRAPLEVFERQPSEKTDAPAASGSTPSETTARSRLHHVSAEVELPVFGQRTCATERTVPAGAFVLLQSETLADGARARLIVARVRVEPAFSDDPTVEEP